MCVGFAKEIANWACPQENSRREAVLSQWGELLHDSTPTAPAQSAPATSRGDAERAGVMQSLIAQSA